MSTNMEEGSKFFALIYRIYYRVLSTQLNPGAKINREPTGKTMLIHCSTPDAEVQVPKMIHWQDINLPKEWLLEQETPPAKPIFDELNLTHIQQYLDGTVKISFHDNQPLRVNKGRHSFAGSESISKRDQDLNEFLQKNFEKLDLKLKSVSSIIPKLALLFTLLNLNLPLHIAELLIKKKNKLNLLFLRPSLIFKLLKPLFSKVN